MLHNPWSVGSGTEITILRSDSMQSLDSSDAMRCSQIETLNVVGFPSLDSVQSPAEASFMPGFTQIHMSTDLVPTETVQKYLIFHVRPYPYNRSCFGA